LLNRISLTVPTTLKVLDQVLAWFDQLRQPAIQHKDWLQCQLALAEGFTNAVRHAHRDLPPETPIDLEAALDNSAIELRIWDSGPPFNLASHINASPTQSTNTQSGGGRGLAILLQIADRLSYERTEDARNCLLIVKHYHLLSSEEG